MENEIRHFNGQAATNRRAFVKKGLLVTLSGTAGINLLFGCTGMDDEEGQKVSPPEDLMQEHGLLNRVLLIYDACKTHLANKTSFPREAIGQAANIIRTFVEDYHRKEPGYLRAGAIHAKGIIAYKKY